jgi:hypothetical protein
VLAVHAGPGLLSLVAAVNVLTRARHRFAIAPSPQVPPRAHDHAAGPQRADDHPGAPEPGGARRGALAKEELSEFHRYDGAGHGFGGRLKITNRR